MNDPVLTIPLALGFGAFILTMVGNFLAIMKLLNHRDEKHRKALDASTESRERQSQALAAKVDAHRELVRGEITRMDREIGDLRVKLATIPDRNEMDSIIKDRTNPIEKKLDAIVLHLLSGGVIQKGGDQYKDII